MISVKSKRMKAQLILIITTVSIFWIWSGCEEDDRTGPGLIPTSGTATINSRYVNNQVSGFSFDQAVVVRFPNIAGIFPDIEVFAQINDTGRIVGVFFGRPDSLLPTFRLLHQFGSIDSAQSYFQTLGEIPDTTYLDLALFVSANQIWAVKTRRNNFAKILIRHTIAYTDSSKPSSPTPYGEATFDWAYQPNGSRQF